MSTSLTKREDHDMYFDGDFIYVTGGATFSGTTTVGTFAMSSGPTGTTAGAAWTSGAPAFTAGQQYITLKAGSTTYRIPVFANS